MASPARSEIADDEFSVNELLQSTPPADVMAGCHDNAGKPQSALTPPGGVCVAGTGNASPAAADVSWS